MGGELNPAVKRLAYAPTYAGKKEEISGAKQTDNEETGKKDIENEKKVKRLKVKHR